MSEDIKPGLMGEYTDEELNAKVVAHAKYFTVVQVNRGGYVRGGSNYDRHQVDTLEDARVLAAELYTVDKTRGILIYAVADFAGANGFSRPVENYPNKDYLSKGQKAKIEIKRKADARAALRETRMNLGKGRIDKPATQLPRVDEIPVVVPEGFDEADEALGYVTID